MEIKERNEQIKQMWMDGYSVEEIAEKFKMKQTTIASYVTKKPSRYKRRKKGDL